ncbi:hypothetical protein GIB67_021106 [Kingdonia uniflora]|uniref:Pectinesterase n=1 Tax=Kingdonia uniflora TaxID=39325 RepID=A0A7J7N745_9MAGN|nr:hypothetical protein GIB67_021106 [Kingdonia uniflora]
MVCPSTALTVNQSNAHSFPNICSHSHNPELCITALSQTMTDFGPVGQLDEDGLLLGFLNDSVSGIREMIEIANNVNGLTNDLKKKVALADCVGLMHLSLYRTMDTLMLLGNNSTTLSDHDVRTWLSAILTNHITCLDGLQGLARDEMELGLEDLINGARISLAILASKSPPSNDVTISPLYGKLPSWTTRRDRKLLHVLPNAATPYANVVVAKDGSGRYYTVKEAIANAPDNSMTSLYNTAVVGDRFIAQDLWIRNTAGPSKGQAVALRVGADQSVINRCRIDGYQDTLCTFNLRQFYRECQISGTVDFIFGDASVVFQNCKIIARKPLSGQGNMITAQGRADRNQNTGISFQNCDIIASSDLALVKGYVKTYLGRPWREYSRTVYMQSNIGDHIDPSGWSIWNGDYGLETLYYGEYSNRGLGAGVRMRVKWPGYHVITNPADAKPFTVANLIQGGTWLKSTGVPFDEGL